jgi:hypothetical protein
MKLNEDHGTRSRLGEAQVAHVNSWYVPGGGPFYPTHTYVGIAFFDNVSHSEAVQSSVKPPQGQSIGRCKVCVHSPHSAMIRIIPHVPGSDRLSRKGLCGLKFSSDINLKAVARGSFLASQGIAS